MVREEHRAVIVGSGPAGATAALYLARSGLNPIVLHGDTPGGQLTMTNDLENYPGWEGSGSDLVDEMENQAKEFGAEFRYEVVTSVEFYDSKKILNTDSGKEYIAECVIIATGAKPNTLGLPNETRLFGRGVCTCALCDGPLFRNKRAVVVGGGNVACQEALFLSKLCSSVTLIHRRDKLSCEVVNQKRLASSTVSIKWNSIVVDILGENRVAGVRIKNRETNENSTIACDAVFIAIGHHPATDIFAKYVQVDKRGYFVSKYSTETNIKGVFVAGDCASPEHKQAILSSSAGARAALHAERLLLDDVKTALN